MKHSVGWFNLAGADRNIRAHLMVSRQRIFTGRDVKRPKLFFYALCGIKYPAESLRPMAAGDRRCAGCHSTGAAIARAMDNVAHIETIGTGVPRHPVL